MYITGNVICYILQIYSLNMKCNLMDGNYAARQRLEPGTLSYRVSALQNKGIYFAASTRVRIICCIGSRPHPLMK